MVSRTITTERSRVRNWIFEHQLGSRGHARVAFHGDCSTPVELCARGLPDAFLVRRGLEMETPAVCTINVRCRSCIQCSRHRARLWAARARDEIAAASRTWFGTLTLSPENALKSLFAAELKLSQTGWQLPEVSETELFNAVVDQVSPELTRWLKRVRKNSGAALRYVLVSEAHKSGLPHWHLLLHEVTGTVRKRQLEDAWRNGFSHFRLVDKVDSRVPYYITKYLTKSATTPRLRASKDYGRTAVRTIAERLEAALLLPELKARLPETREATITPETTREPAKEEI